MGKKLLRGKSVDIVSWIFTILAVLIAIGGIILEFTIEEKESVVLIMKIESILYTVIAAVVSGMYHVTRNAKTELLMKLEKQTEAINNCPRMLAFHTEGHILEDKIDEISRLEQSHQKWFLAKYLSKLFSVSMQDCAIKIDAQSYSSFSSELFAECENSIKLTGSMRPYEWLEMLGIDDSNGTKAKFFNNKISWDGFKINENNHSIKLANYHNIENRLRIVCLTKDDWKYLFLSELCLDAYYFINGYSYNKNDLKTYFVEYKDSKGFNPMQYEYALYDESLLLKWDKKEVKIIISKNALDEQQKIEFKTICDFFEQNATAGHSFQDLKYEIREKKLEYLKLICDNKLLPHKLCYLYPEGVKNWYNYMNYENNIYLSEASDALKRGLKYFVDNKIINNENVNILEIGPGNGLRFDHICDCYGSENINSYECIDISKDFLEKAQEKIKMRIPNKLKEHTPIDWCDRESCKNIQVKDKNIIISYNSTLFTENGFSWDRFKPAKSVFITLDLYTGEGDENLETYYEGYKLFLHPLKIFEIPIEERDIVSKDLFNKEYDESKSVFNILFNLKGYIKLLKEKTNFELKNPIEVEGDKKYWEYINKRKQLTEIDKLIVLSSLKFKYTENVKDQVKKYFENNASWADVETFVDESNKYISICLKRRSEKSKK